MINLMATRDNSIVKSHDQTKTKKKLKSTIITKSCAHALTDDKIVKSAFNKNNVETIKIVK